MTNSRRAGTVFLVTLSALFAVAHAWPAWSEEQAPAAAPPHTSCQPSAFRVVVDVGHTLNVPGALSARGMPEYAFNLQLAQQIKETLVDAGFDNTVLLITDQAPPGGLFERATIANAGRAICLSRSIRRLRVLRRFWRPGLYEGQDQHLQR